MIQTRRKTLYVCEIKFCQNTVPAGVVEEVEEKIARLSMPRRTTVRPVLIHTGEVSPAVEEAGFATVDCGEFLR